MNKAIDFPTAPVGQIAGAATAAASPNHGAYGRGVLFCVIATVLMGIMFPVMTDALTHIDPFTFTSLRYLIAGSAF